jgi:S-adenosyl methyltransferase
VTPRRVTPQLRSRPGGSRNAHVLIPDVHEAALEAAPDAPVVYVDYDPVVVAHARALLTKPNPLSRRSAGTCGTRNRSSKTPNYGN